MSASFISFLANLSVFVRNVDKYRLISAIVIESNLFQVQFWYDCLMCRGVGDLHPDDFSRFTRWVVFAMCVLLYLSMCVFLIVSFVCWVCYGIAFSKNFVILGWGHFPWGYKVHS